MRRIALLAVAAAAALGLAAPAGAVTISNGTVTLGVNPQGDLNDRTAGIGLTYNATGNDGTIDGCLCEGWGAGAAGPAAFVGVADEAAGNRGYATPVSFTSNATSAVSTVDVLAADGTTHALRVKQDFHPSPSTKNLYEITTTLTNLTGAALTDVRYERSMDWDIEPTPFDEYVTINRGPTPPATLSYSDDNGINDADPFTLDRQGNPETINQNVVDNGPDDHGARFTFKFGTLAAGESRQFYLYYGAAGDEDEANTAVSAAALEMFSYGQPDIRSVADPLDPGCPPNLPAACDGPGKGEPNTFIWGFRAVGGRPVIPPTLTLAPKTGSATAGTGTSVTASLHDEAGGAVPGAKIVFAVSGANSTGNAATTDSAGNATFSYTGANAGDDSILACLDSNDNNACDPGEVADSASRNWVAQQVDSNQQQSPQPKLGETVVAGTVSGTVRVKGRDGKFHVLGANEAIPLGSTIDTTKGRVRLTSASGPNGKVQTADFYQGVFRVTQSGGRKPITLLKLTAPLSCSTKKSRKATAAAKRRKLRRLWGDGHGRFRTTGKRAAATVRGTKWLTEDRCNSTKITVKRGVVSVRDFVKRKTVLVKKGHSYVARKKPKKKK